MCLPSRSHRSVVCNWSYDAFECFLYAWVHPWTQFSDDISAIFGQIWKINSLMNSANFSILDRMGVMNFRNPQFFFIWVVNICCIETPEDNPLDFFPSVPLVCTKTFRLCAGCWNSTVLLFWLRPHWKLPESFTTAESTTQTFIGLPLTVQRYVV